KPRNATVTFDQFNIPVRVHTLVYNCPRFVGIIEQPSRVGTPGQQVQDGRGNCPILRGATWQATPPMSNATWTRIYVPNSLDNRRFTTVDQGMNAYVTTIFGLFEIM